MTHSTYVSWMNRPQIRGKILWNHLNISAYYQAMFTHRSIGELVAIYTLKTQHSKSLYKLQTYTFTQK